MSSQQQRSKLYRLIVGNRRRPLSKVAALVLTISVGASVLVHAGQKESPIRVSLPGVAPTAMQAAAAATQAAPIKLPKPVPTRPKGAIPSGVVRRFPRQNPLPLAGQSKTRPIHASTDFDSDRFLQSIRWSMHSGVLTPRSQEAKPLRPIRIESKPADVAKVNQPPRNPAADSGLEGEIAVQRPKPVDAMPHASSLAESIESERVASVTSTKAIRSTNYDRSQFDQSIRRSQQNMTTEAIPVAETPLARETEFKTGLFTESIQRSLAQVASRPSPSTRPVTQFDPARFQKSIELANESVSRSPAVSLPATDLDVKLFDDSILSSLAGIPVTGASPAAETAFDLDRFTKSVESSLEARRMPRTAYDVDRFRHSIDQSIKRPRANNSSPRPMTNYNTAGFQRSISASLSAAQLPSPQPTPIAKKKADGTTPEPRAAWHVLNDFSPTPVDSRAMHHDGNREALPYDAKRNVPTQRPLVEWGREFYGDGITPRGLNVFGAKNLVRPKFYVYGDYRTSVIAGRNCAGRTDNWAHRLNLDMDFQITDTERFHTFIGPLDQGNQFTRLQLVDGDFQWREEINFTPLTGFFEGDLGVMMGAAHNQTSPFEIPFTIGLVPLLFQNGIWMEDAVTGAAVAIPARHSRLLNWSNYDATFFAVVDQLNSAAFAGNEHAAQAFGTAWFIEAYGGYIESGYAYVRDRNQSEFSYHNITASFTRRYFDRISNSMRVIVNAGQDLPDANRTADGVLLLAENSWITRWPLTVIPYANFFVGWDRPQSVARAAGSGGILRNTGINFETDGLNGFATLDTTASDTAGFSLGIDLIGDDLDRQLLLEFSYLSPHGDKNAAVPDDQYAVGSRYQFPISHRTLLRFDTMYGWRRGIEDVYGTRMEYRWKF